MVCRGLVCLGGAAQVWAWSAPAGELPGTGWRKARDAAVGPAIAGCHRVGGVGYAMTPGGFLVC